MDIVMAVDIGGSKYMPGFVDGKGNILYQERLEWWSVEADSIVEQIKDGLHGICDRHPDLARQARAGGLTIPGFADPVTGVWAESDFLVVKDLPICDILSEEFGIPFFADNDGNACALAEKYFGGAKDHRDFLYMTVSTGIGGALYLDGELYYGASWHAGEIGMFVVEEYGRPSDTGSVDGIAEMYASGRGLVQNYAEAGGKPGSDGETPGGIEISEMASDGDQTALNILALEGRYLGRIIANARALANFQKIILGGGVSLMFDQFKDSLFKEFHRIHPRGDIEIAATDLGYSGAFLGAAAVGIRGFQGVQRRREAGDRKAGLFRVHIGDTADAVLESEGRGLKGEGSSFGSFLAAKNIRDEGTSLNQLLAQSNNAADEETLRRIGNGIGKAIACAGVLLDPGEIMIEGRYIPEKVFRDSISEAVIRETYYRGNLPFSIIYK